MKWRKSPDTLVRRFSELVPEDPRVSRRQMFGYPCAFVGGNLFMGLHQDAMILRLSNDDRATFLGFEGAASFEPMPGRPMREYVVIPPALLDRPAALLPWVRRSLEYAAAVPSKKAGRATKPARRRAPTPKRPTRRSG